MTQAARYVVNGLAATAVHFGVLSFTLEVVGLRSAGLANLLAALVGIAASFLGSRYYVFRSTRQGIVRQGMKFVGLYLGIAALHYLVLRIWTDDLGHDYRIGFLLATGLQVSLSYVGNKLLVFRT